MTHNPLISLFLLAAATFATTAATAGEARAAGDYLDGQPQQVKTVCPGATVSTPNTRAWVGYYTDPSPLYPQTGDVAYVRAIAANIGCVNDAVSVELFLPLGASLAISTANPVDCTLTNGTATQGVTCLQTPIAGINNGYNFTATQLAPGWWIDLRVPLVYNHALAGSAGGNSHLLFAAVSSTWGTMWPSVPVSIAYRAQLNNQVTSGVTTLGASLGFDLFSYYGAGNLYVDFGTSSSLGQSTPAYAVPDTLASSPYTSTLQQLVPSTTYYWRPRFVTTAGVSFTGTLQSFTTAWTPPVTLTVGIAGTGQGRVTSTAGIDCGFWSPNQCTVSVAPGTMVTLDAAPALSAYGYNLFAGWSGACSGFATCTVPVWQAAAVTANFDHYEHYLMPIMFACIAGTGWC